MSETKEEQVILAELKLARESIEKANESLKHIEEKLGLREVEKIEPRSSITIKEVNEILQVKRKDLAKEVLSIEEIKNRVYADNYLGLKSKQTPFAIFGEVKAVTVMIERPNQNDIPQNIILGDDEFRIIITHWSKSLEEKMLQLKNKFVVLTKVFLTEMNAREESFASQKFPTLTEFQVKDRAVFLPSFRVVKGCDVLQIIEE